MDIDIIIMGIIVVAIGILAIRIKNPQKFEEFKEAVEDFWYHLKNYFK